MSEISPWIALFFAFPLILVTGGRWNISIAAWFGPALLLHFLHSQSPGIGFLIVAGVFAIAFFFSWKGLVPLPQPFYTGFIIFLALYSTLPYLSDRILTPLAPGYLSTLVYPVTLVLLEMISARLSPYGSWGSLAYTQFGNLSLMQIASFSGIYGITFIIGWGGSSLAWAWGSGFTPLALSGMGVYVTFLALVFLIGGGRVAFGPKHVPTVRVALITESDLKGGRSFFTAAQTFMGPGNMDDEKWEEVREITREVHDALFSLSKREAKAGAKIILWAEAAGLVFAEEEPALLERAKTFAREHRVCLAVPMGTIHREVRKFENKLALITPEGAIAWQYHKSRPVPGGELSHTLRGDSTPRTIDTPYGRLGVLICFDGDFPFLGSPYKKEKIDILLVPASDWKEIDPIHSEMAVFRGVEIGASVLRPARAGLSIASDPYGRVIASQDYFSTTDRTLVAYVPIRGIH